MADAKQRQQKKTYGTCYICGKPDADKKGEHVIPLSLFGSPRPPNLLTWPAHHRCDQHLHEDYIRVVLAGLSAPYNETARQLVDEIIPRSLQNNHRMFREIRSALRLHMQGRSLGGIWISGPAINVDRERFYPTLRKIIRGLYYHQRRHYFPADARLRWSLIAMPLPHYDDLFQSSLPGSSYGDVFEYRLRVLAVEPLERLEWWLRFYRTVTLQCLTTCVPRPVPSHDLSVALGERQDG